MKEFNSYTPDIKDPDTDNPYGSFVDEGSGEAGTPVLADFMNSAKALLEKLMAEAGLTYDGDVDDVTSCQSWDALKSLFVDLVAAQTIAGLKTFSSIPVLPGSNPTTDNQAARKAYVDSVVSALSSVYVALTGAQTIAGIKTFSSTPVVPSNPIASGDTGAVRGDDVYDYAVALTGTQTIAGTKTFSSTPVVPSNPIASGDTGAVRSDDVYDYLNSVQTFAGAKTFSSIPVVPNNPVEEGDTGAVRGDNVYDYVTGYAVALTGAQTIAGAKTFSSIPFLPSSDPSWDDQATRKLYVDNLDDENVKLTGDQTIAGVKTFSGNIVSNGRIQPSLSEVEITFPSGYTVLSRGIWSFPSINSSWYIQESIAGSWDTIQTLDSAANGIFSNGVNTRIYNPSSETVVPCNVY